MRISGKALNLLLFAAYSLTNAVRTGSLRKTNPTASSTPRRLEKFNDCLVVKSFVEYEKQKGESEVCSCVVEGNNVADLSGLSEEVCSELNSSESMISSSTGFYFDPASQVASVPVGALLETTSIVEEKVSDRKRRRLREGEKKVLVVRGEFDDSNTSSSEDKLREEVFGVGGTDSLNLSSGYAACSYGKLTFIPADVGNNGVHTAIVTGQNVAGTDNSIIRGAMTNKWQADLGSLNTHDLDYVILCIPPGTNGGWIAYAYINWYLSVYNNYWCEKPSGLMHEVGHNLGLSHSGEGSNEYADQSGLMGYSYNSDEGPIMCFNGVKTWQLNWFPAYHQSVESDDSYYWQGDLIGFVNLYEAQTGDIMIFKLNPKAANDSYEWYVHFNRQVGFNSGVREGGNQVLVAKRPRGTSYANSLILGKLTSGSSYTIPNFGDEGDLTIDVGDITLNGNSRSTAAVTIQYGNAPTDPPVPPPTDPPVPPPTEPPVPLPTEPPVPPPTEPPVPLPTEPPVPLPTEPPVPPPTEPPVPPPTEPPVPLPTEPPVPPPTDPPVPPPTEPPVPPPTEPPVPPPTEPPVPPPTEPPVPPPTEPPISEPPVVSPTDPPCTQCTNEETPWMVNNNKKCDTSPALMSKHCNNSAYWVNNNFCQLSCFVYGNGFDGDNCCITPTPAPAPVEPGPCTQCTDKETPWMEDNNVDCTTSTGLDRRCKENAGWRRNNYCQLSCFVSGNGYAGDNCCIAPTPAPAPVEQEPCTQCTDEETPWMIRNDKDCTGSTSILNRKCKSNSGWRTNKYCQLSCFANGNGYDGDNCCPS